MSFQPVSPRSHESYLSEWRDARVGVIVARYAFGQARIKCYIETDWHSVGPEL